MSADQKTGQRHPDLGKLSLAILEHLVEPVLGQKAINEIGTPLAEQELLRSIAETLERTEQRFTAECSDQDICDAVINLPLGNLPSVVKATRDFFARPTDTTLELILTKQLETTFPFFTRERIQVNVSTYLRILREECVNISSDIREKLDSLALLDIQGNIARLVGMFDKGITVRVSSTNQVTTTDIRTIFVEELQRTGANTTNKQLEEIEEKISKIIAKSSERLLQIDRDDFKMLMSLLYLSPNDREFLSSIGNTTFGVGDYARLSYHSLHQATRIVRSWVEAGFIVESESGYRLQPRTLEMVEKVKNTHIIIFKW